MPLNISPVDPRALAQIAGNPVPHLNLPLFGQQDQGYGNALLQGAQIAGQLQTAQNNLAGQKQMNQFTQGQENVRQDKQLFGAAQNQQATIAAENQRAALQARIQAAQLAQNAQYQQGQLGISQQNADINKGQLGLQGQQLDQQKSYQQQEIDSKQQQLKLEAMKTMMPMQLAQLGASSSMMMMGLNQYANDPAKLKEFIQHQNQVDVKNGVISQEDADKRLQMSPQDLQQDAMRTVITTGIANQSKNSNMGNMMPNMTNMYGNIGMGKTTTDDTQKGLVATGRSLIDSSAPIINFNPDLFSYGSQLEQQAGNVAGKSPQIAKDAWNYISKISGGTIPTAEDATNLDAAGKSFESNMLQSIMSTLNQQKGSRFNRMSVEVLEPEIAKIGEDTPQSAFSKMVTLQQRMERAGTYETQLVQQGIPADSDKFHDMVIDFMKSAPVPGKLTVSLPDGSQQAWGYDEIKKFADHNKISFQEAVQHVMTMQPNTQQTQPQAVNQPTQ